MKKQTKSKLFKTGAISSLSLLVLPLAAMADQSPVKEKWKCKYCPYDDIPTWQNVLGIGAANVSNDSFKFGDFTGYDKGEFYGLLNLDSRYREEARYFQLQATDLGLESGALSMEYGNQGSYKFNFSAQQIPKLDSDTARTPYLGDLNQTLPGTWVAGADTSGFTALNTTLHPSNLYSKRKRFDVGFSYVLKPGNEFDVKFSRQNKEGYLSFGGTLGFQSAQLAVPISYNTDNMSLGAQWNKDSYHVSLKYEMSTFSNDDATFRWDNAYSAGGSGQSALPPSNRFHHLTLQAVYRLSESLSFNGHLSAGKAEQDERFVATTVGPAAGTDLTGRSLDGEVNTLSAHLRALYKLSSNWRLEATYRHQEQDNQTPRLNLDYVILDSATGTTANRTSFPFGFRNQTMSIKSLNMFKGGKSLQVGLDHKVRDRTYQEVDRTTEQVLWGKFSNRIGSLWNYALKAQTGDRKFKGNYTPLAGLPSAENPLMRKFYLADRSQSKVDFQVNGSISTRLSIGFSVATAADDYSDTQIGLKEGNEQSLNFNVQYSLSDNLQLNYFGNHMVIDSLQAGAGWQADLEDSIVTHGINLRYLVMEDNKMVADLDLVQADAKSAVTQGSAFPDMENSRLDVTLGLSYRWNPNLKIKGFYRYEDFSQKDWHVDGIQPNSINNVLSLGEISPEYSIGMVGVQIQYDFGKKEEK